MKRGKRHYHRVIAYEPSEDLTRQGNPRVYTITLSCGHKLYEYHSVRIAVLGFQLELIWKEMVKTGKTPDLEKLPRMHCHSCASGKAHTTDALEKENRDKRITEDVGDIES